MCTECTECTECAPFISYFAEQILDRIPHQGTGANIRIHVKGSGRRTNHPGEGTVQIEEPPIHPYTQTHAPIVHVPIHWFRFGNGSYIQILWNFQSLSMTVEEFHFQILSKYPCSIFRLGFWFRVWYPTNLSHLFGQLPAETHPQVIRFPGRVLIVDQ